MLSFIFLTFVFVLPLSYFILPKGNNLHEVLHLPSYWLKLYRVDTTHITSERINYGRHHRQYFLYIPPPKGSSDLSKIIVYFHGGGWKFGKPSQFIASITALHEAGYPVILPSVRRTPWSNYFHIRSDLNELLLAILKLQQRENYSNQKIVVGGMSAGGNLAALLCYDQQALASIGKDQSLFAGLLACGAALDLRKMRKSLVVHAFAGSRSSIQFSLANPIEHLDKTSPIPILCLHGTKDGLVAYESAHAFADAIRHHHPNSIRFITLPEGTHLDAASWSFSQSQLKLEILNWIRQL
jgi:acetyl esterase/lipase